MLSSAWFAPMSAFPVSVLNGKDEYKLQKQINYSYYACKQEHISFQDMVYLYYVKLDQDILDMQS